MKVRPVGAEMFHADRRTDTRKLIVAFRNFASAHKQYSTKNPKSYTNQFYSKLLILNISNFYVEATSMRCLRANLRG